VSEATDPHETPEEDDLLRVDGQRSPDGSLLVTVVGELDVHTAPRLVSMVEALVDPGTSSLLLDLSGVSFIDSSGLRTLVTLWTGSAGAGRTITLHDASRPVRRVIEVTGLAGHFGLPETDQSADA
jgi:anti-sigma B factor antagonist